MGDLGRYHHLGTDAASGLPVSEDGLGFAAGVARDEGGVRVGGVDEITACGHERVENLERGGRIRRPAERVAAQCQRVDIELGISDCCHCAPVVGMMFHAHLTPGGPERPLGHPGGRNAANSSVTRRRESVNRYSAGGRPPLFPDGAVVPVRVRTSRRASTR